MQMFFQLSWNEQHIHLTQMLKQTNEQTTLQYAEAKEKPQTTWWNAMS